MSTPADEAALIVLPELIEPATEADRVLTILPHGSILDAALAPDGSAAYVLVMQDAYDLWRLMHPFLFKAAALVVLCLLLLLIWRWWRAPALPRKSREAQPASPYDVLTRAPVGRGRPVMALKLLLVLTLAAAAGNLTVRKVPQAWADWYQWPSVRAFNWLGGPNYKYVLWRPYFRSSFFGELWLHVPALWKVSLQDGRRLAEYHIPGEPIGGHIQPAGNQISKLAVSHDGRRLHFVRHEGGKLYLSAIDTATGEVAAEWSAPYYTQGGDKVTSVAFDPLGRYVHIIEPKAKHIRITRLAADDLSDIASFDFDPEPEIVAFPRITTVTRGWWSEDARIFRTLLRRRDDAARQDFTAPYDEHLVEFGTSDWRILREAPLHGRRYGGGAEGGFTPDGRYALLDPGREHTDPRARQGTFMGGSFIRELWDVEQLRRIARFESTGSIRVEPLGHAVIISTSPRSLQLQQSPSPPLHWRLDLNTLQMSLPRAAPYSWPATMVAAIGTWPPRDVAFLRHTPDGSWSVAFDGNKAHVIDWSIAAQR